MDIIDKAELDRSFPALDYSVIDSIDIPCLLTTADLPASGPVVLHANDAFFALGGWSRAEIIGQPPTLADGSLPSASLAADLTECARHQKPVQNDGISYRDGGQLRLVSWTVSGVRNGDGILAGFLILIQDRTEFYRRGPTPGQDSDRVTGLPQRQTFLRLLQTWIAEVETRGGPAPIICYVEIDEFYQLAAVLANSEMDDLASQFAARLRLLPLMSLIGYSAQDRYLLASDNFLFLEDIQSHLGSAYEIAGKPVHLRMTFGIALYPVDGHAADDLMRAAVFAAAEGRRKGGNCISLYYTGLAERHRRSRHLEEGLEDAITHKQFHLVFQPRICTRTKTTVAAEVLLRWTHPVFGAVGPSEFVPLLERSGRMPEITRWISAAAIGEQAHWRKEGKDIAISINACRGDLEDGAAPLLKTLRAAVDQHRISPDRVEIEVTESVVGTEAVRAGVEAIAAAGFGISIDDFGREQSNLFALTAYPIRTIKLDRDIVKLCADDSRAGVILRHTALMARDLGVRTVAEGVEDRAVFDVVRSAAFDEVQGYYVARPLAADAFRRFYRNPIPD